MFRRGPTPIAAPAALVGSVIAFHVVDHRLVPPRVHLVTHVLAGAASVAAASAMGAGRHELGLDPARFVPGLKAGLTAGVATAAVIGIAAAVPALEPVLADPRAADTTAGSLTFRLALDIPLGTALYEELVFRSSLLALTRRHVSDGVAVAITSALFGLWHVLPALEDRQHNPVAQRYPLLLTVMPTVAVTAVAGVGFSRLRLRSGHVVAPVVAHAMNNAAALVAATVVNRRRARREAGEASPPPPHR